MRSVAGPSLSALPSTIWVYLRECARIDTRALAAFRIALGSLVVADLLLRARNFQLFYTDDGVVPQWLAQEQLWSTAFSFYFFTSDPNAILALYVLQGLIAVQLIVGYRTTVATILSFLFVVSLDYHNPFVLSYADLLFRLLFFWGIFLPLGERFSIDAIQADRTPRGSIVHVATVPILLQVVYVYFRNGIHKTHSDAWATGEAAVFVFGLDHMTFLFGDLLRNVPTLLQYGGRLWFYMMLASPLLFLLSGRKRTALVGLFIAGHASFALTVRIGAFPYVSITGLLLFLQASFWNDLDAVRSRLGIESPLSKIRSTLRPIGDVAPGPVFTADSHVRARTFVYEFAIAVVLITIVFVAALSLLGAVGVVDSEERHEYEVERVAYSIGIGQPEWGIFAPNPRDIDQYYVIAAETTDGELVDAYNDRPLTYERPYDGQLQKQFGTYRERFYMGSVRAGGEDGDVPRLFSEHLCETWETDDGAELTRLSIYHVTERVEPETIDAPEERDRNSRQIHKHSCGNAEPEWIQPPEF